MARLKLPLLSRRGWPWSQGKSQQQSPDEAKVKPLRPSKQLSISGPPAALCDRCSRLDLESMFTRETIEQDLGPLSGFATAYCGFCALVSEAIARAWGSEWDTRKLCDAFEDAPKLFMQSKSPLSIRAADGGGNTERPQPRLLLAVDHIPVGVEEDNAVVVNKEIARIKNRHIVAEIECIPDPDVPLSIVADTYLTRRELRAHADVELAKQWLEECGAHKHSKSEEHAHADGDDALFQDPGFRLIDVEEECLVQETDRCDYIALSYVWGAIATILQKSDDPDEKPVLLATKDNLERLSESGGLSAKKVEEAEEARIPNTVRDAMEFTRELGMKYLWVDTLCIVQDDPEDKGRLIGAMDDVYASATATLIAASGTSADAGLRGVSDRAPTPITPVKIPLPSYQGNLNLSICLPTLSQLVRGARWHTRGWTFQEQALSPRCLYFTPTELFFNCSELQCREGYALEDYDCEVELRTGPPWWTRNLRKDPDPTPYRYLGDAEGLGGMEYQAAVEDYMQKDLTYSGDVLNAFEGVFNRFSGGDRDARISIGKTQGIPPRLLYLGLLWSPSDEATKRPEITKPKEGSLPHFATWSW